MSRHAPLKIDHRGSTMPLRQLARVVDVSYQTLLSRYQHGKRGAELTAPATNQPGEQHPRWSQEFRYQGLL